MEKWTDEQVFQWLQRECSISQKLAHTFKVQKIDGEALIELSQDELTGSPFGLTVGEAKKVIRSVRTSQTSTRQLFVAIWLKSGTHAEMMLFARGLRLL